MVIAERSAGALTGSKSVVCGRSAGWWGHGLIKTLMRMGRQDRLRFGRSATTIWWTMMMMSCFESLLGREEYHVRAAQDLAQALWSMSLA